MTPTAFLSECSRRGITLAVAHAPRSAHELPAIKIRATAPVPPKVMDTIRANKRGIVAALESRHNERRYKRVCTCVRCACPDIDADCDAELAALASDADAELSEADPETAARVARVALAERGAVSIHTTQGGSRLYEDRHGLFGYVPPGGDPGDFIDNFPASMQATARRMYGLRSPDSVFVPNTGVKKVQGTCTSVARRPRPKAF